MDQKETIFGTRAVMEAIRGKREIEKIFIQAGLNNDLIKEKFDAKIANDTVIRIKSELDEKKLLRRRYLYTTNYALLHSDTEVAPFLALTELYNVNIKLLDTINNSLTEKVKTSKYGKQLNEFVLKIKSQEN